MFDPPDGGELRMTQRIGGRYFDAKRKWLSFITIIGVNDLNLHWYFVIITSKSDTNLKESYGKE
jgi:hypothetical protein